MIEKAHESHGAIIKRLKRANGHMLKVISMIEDGESCADVARQLQAVFKAVSNAKQTLIRDHIDHCLSVEAIKTRSAVDIKKELAEITKYL
ncbi:MAG: metal-sensing transcriptional repressor [Desulfobacula sp.]|jgi:uncharacterized protein|nr:metal-sensing transcriptional repressor [Desulfobacula sp.]